MSSAEFKTFRASGGAGSQVDRQPGDGPTPGVGGPDDPAEINIMPGTMSVAASHRHAKPLSHEETQLADRTARRLHEQMRAFLAVLPVEVRNASGLARFLEVDRTTCQRLVFTVTRPYAGLSVIDRLPGAKGLRQVVEAARRAAPSLNAETLVSLEAAIDRFEDVLRKLGGSQSVLIRRIAATPTHGTSAHLPSEQPAAARQRLFEAAAELTGRWSETWLAVYAYLARNGEGSTIDVARAHGLIGHLARADAVPLTFHNFSSRRPDEPSSSSEVAQGFQPLCMEGADRAPESVLTGFTTDPPPVVSSRQPGEYLVQAIDTESGSGRPVDLMLGTRNTMAHPAKQSPAIEEVWAMINFPVRRLVFDVYLHRDLARECIPALDAHLWRPDFAAHVGDRWQTRFADGPRLELLGQGLDNAATPAYGRHVELTRFLFERIDADPSRFIGYRCAMDYPVWRTGYCMSFDFSAGEDGE